LPSTYLRHNDSWRDYLIGDGNERWRRIFTDPNFCGSDKTCASDVDDLQFYATDFFEQIADETNNTTAQGVLPSYRMSRALLNADPDDRPAVYFRGGDTDNAITCLAADIPPPVQASTDTSPVRLRGTSDDLYLDRNRRPNEFKSLSQATLTLGATGISPTTQTTKLQAALGYAIALAPNADLVPFISASQSITNTTGKPLSVDSSNFAAAGFLATALVASSDSYAQVISAKPQLLVNTADNSQVATFRFIYAPWTFRTVGPGEIPFNLNTAYPVPFLGGTLVQLLFDVRNDSAIYTDRGNNSKLFSIYQNYERLGSRIGLAFNTPPNLPSLTLVVAETYQHGFMGSVRTADLFEASLAYNFDPSNFFSLKGSYKNGYDEGTSVRGRSWTIGLAARY
jgi:hypothetical protein